MRKRAKKKKKTRKRTRMKSLQNKTSNVYVLDVMKKSTGFIDITTHAVNVSTLFISFVKSFQISTKTFVMFILFTYSKRGITTIGGYVISVVVLMGPVSQCDFDVDVKCAIKRQQKNIIYHPSHEHPLVRIPKDLLYECDACGMKHEGVFYLCPMCVGPFIHSHCAFLPKKLQIQRYTNDFFHHIHPLELSYSFPKADQKSKFNPLCRVCRQAFPKEILWIYKCEKCKYYTHLDCATSRNEPFMSILTSPGTGKIIKNYEDAELPNLLHLPFPDPSYSLLKHLFFKENGGSSTCKTHHQHPLTLVDARCGDITIPTSSTIKPISYHDPMKRIQLLCDGCVRPITSGPIYVCDNEGQCNFMLHEWCSRLPAKLNGHFAHQQHTLILHSKAPGEFFGVFWGVLV
ncbi:putative chromatin regulator PHD family [Helianthus annuus]|nr:putative chromatin regulator PHD family [Helianthus annuus]